MESKPVAITDFKGLNEAQDPLNMEPGAAVAMRNTVVTDNSSVKSRDGYSLVTAGALSETYVTNSGKRGFTVDAGTLYEVTPEGALVTRASGLPTGRYYWADMGDQILLSGPVYAALRDGEYAEFPDKAAAPRVTTVLGSLPEGEYIVSITPVAGEIEGPASAPSHHFVDGSQDLSITAPDAGALYRVYLSTTNGDVLYLADNLLPGETLVISSVAMLAHALDDELLDAVSFPACSHIAWFNSQVWRAEFDQSQDTSFVYPSGVFRPAVCKVTEYLPIPGEITLMASAGPQLIIATHQRIYGYDGGSLNELAPFGAPDHTRIAYDDAGQLWFWTKRGMASASPMELKTYDTVRTVEADSVAVQRLRDPDGDQIVAIFNKTS